MSNLIVRKARKDYVCDCCGHIIKAGTEYLDKCIIIYGTPVKHERYHDECPAKSAVEQLFKRIIDADGDLIASEPSGEKYHVVGIVWYDGFCHVQFRRWLKKEVVTIVIDAVEDWIDEHGERILSKV